VQWVHSSVFPLEKRSSQYEEVSRVDKREQIAIFLDRKSGAEMTGLSADKIERLGWLVIHRVYDHGQNDL